ncbi:hypothetical protein AGMMS49546_08280 [Spirochaetia bacterium]|nr:hypothetical protein AGMMS49546_08280 [Spirochaetia bacterium]
MGTVYAEITLSNAGDASAVRRGFMPEVRQETVNAVVDTGATMLVISEELQRRLGLEIEGTRRTTFADGGQKECGLTEPVKIRWQNRHCSCNAVVIPGAAAALLGVIPLENMDLIVNPVTQILEGAHGDEVVALAM